MTNASKALAGRVKKVARKAIPIPSIGMSFLPPRRRGGKDTATSPAPSPPNSESFTARAVSGTLALHTDLIRLILPPLS